MHCAVLQRACFYRTSWLIQPISTLFHVFRNVQGRLFQLEAERFLGAPTPTTCQTLSKYYEISFIYAASGKESSPTAQDPSSLRVI